MTDHVYPKVTQENLKESALILLSVLSDPTYMQHAPYSNLMSQTIRQEANKFRDLMTQEVEALLASAKEDWLKEMQPPEPESDFDREELLDQQIAETFKDLNEDLDNHSSEYRDNYGILIRLEKTIRSVQTIAEKGSSDTVKMSATTKLMEFQDKQLAVLETLMNLEKAKKIESITRRFFLEIRKFDKLESVADRYLSLIQDID